MSNQVNTDLIEEALELAETYKDWTRGDDRFTRLVKDTIKRDIDGLPTLIEIMKEELDNIALKERIWDERYIKFKRVTK